MRMFLFVLFFIHSNISFAGEGAMVGNGAGKSEANLVQVFDHLEYYLKLALAEAPEAFSIEEKTILQQIETNTPQERLSGGLEFVDRKESEAIFFSSHEQNTKILFNISRLFVIRDQVKQAYSLVDALEVLSFVYCFRYSEADNCRILAKKVAQFNQSLIESFNFASYKKAYVEFFTINRKKLFATDGQSFIDLVSLINKDEICFSGPSQAESIEIVDFYEESFGELDIHSMRLFSTVVADIWFSCGQKQYAGEVYFYIPFQIIGEKQNFDGRAWWSFDHYVMQFVDAPWLSYKRLRRR